ncbi:hypothetical protein [Runella sp. SP2]|uniref:hypothetical protein n=1 Tax=Runella sp. SP2 TaxID=2268026 RepID=UPI000F07EF49|nr:hypothetical protein [Runella sp. SP2]AYQ33081.1 hypothetical protein DTQ70_13355 [Runella sp. SP2]
MKSLLYPLLVFASFVIATFLMFQNLETVFADKLNTLVLYAYAWMFCFVRNLFLGFWQKTLKRLPHSTLCTPPLDIHLQLS